MSILLTARTAHGHPTYYLSVDNAGEVLSSAIQMETLRQSLRRLERKDWWLWSTTIVVMLLLVAALFVLSFPAIRFPGLWRGTMGDAAQLDIAVHAMLGLVLLFSVFVVYQQVLIKRLRRSMGEQLGTIAALQARAEMLEKVAILDPLTQLYNRRFADEHLPLELARAERMGYPVTALMLDLNGFKAINDQYGHAAGDLALSEFAQNLKRCFRNSDLPVRMGGDEFLIVLPECTAEDVPLVLNHLRHLEIEYEGQQIALGFAAGWAQHEHGQSAETLLARADHALYADKRTASADRQRRQAELMLAQTQKMQAMGRLASGVTHDFNNLVTVIRGFSSVLLEQMSASDPLRRPVEQIDRAAERAAQLTQQLLSFARSKTLRADQPADLNGIVTDLAPILKAVLGRKIELHISSDPGAGLTRADPTQVQQIILNLVVNARDAMPAGGRISLRTEPRELDSAFVAAHPGARPGRYVGVAITDTGTGVSEEAKKHMFEPFFTTKGDGGTGLGLSIVYGIVKQLGGYIWVDSELGHGSTFTVYFPRLAAAAKPEPQPSLARAAVA